ncbi:MAG: murein biosynthesis integral membrane protein MurJ [Solirubrobacterales bacterium]|nr:murein biosynthesis integral membrane protein MurJ [Solirubrobacterales bacterium]
MPDPDTAAAAAPDDPGVAAEIEAVPVQSASAGVARNTAIFSIATGLSRIAGLIREVVARRYFGTSGAASAFTIAFQVPNLIRGLFADAALSAAFVPIFTELLEEKRRADAFRLASTLVFVILAALGAITALFIVGAGVVMPVFLPGDEFDQDLVNLTVGLSRVMFPIVVLLGLNGLVVGILNAYGQFTIPALAPLLWNAVIIGALIGLHGLFEGDNQIYAYAIGVLVGTVLQLAIALPGLRKLDFRLTTAFSVRDPLLRKVLVLMLPVTIGLGIINFDLLINSIIGALISEQTPAAIDAAFRVYMLPQGMFSVAVATVLFPTLSRLAARKDFAGLRATMGTGLRQIFLLLIPAAVFTAVLSEPIVRLLYERGEFGQSSTDVVSLALFWFSFSLPFAGANLLLTRTFFSLQQPWLPTKLAGLNLALNTVVSLALYRPFGIAGVVFGTAVASLGMTIGQYIALKRLLGGDLEGPRTLEAIGLTSVAAALMGGAAWVVHRGLEELLGDALLAQAVAVGGAAVVAAAAFFGVALVLRLEEAQQIERFVLRRLRARG